MIQQRDCGNGNCLHFIDISYYVRGRHLYKSSLNNSERLAGQIRQGRESLITIATYIYTVNCNHMNSYKSKDNISCDARQTTIEIEFKSIKHSVNTSIYLLNEI